MAIDLKKLKEQHESLDVAPINAVESGYIMDVEKYIDEEITKRYNSDNREISIDLGIVNFNYNPIKKIHFIGLTHKRKMFLKERLLEDYKKSGWKFDTHIDDGLDGPNRSGIDYFIFKG